MNTFPRILFITSHCPWAPTYGAQLRALNIIRLLNKIGKVSLIIAGPHTSYMENGGIKKTKDEYNIIRMINFKNREELTIIDRLRHEFDSKFSKTFDQIAIDPDIEYIRKTLSNYDIIWLHSIRIPDAFRIFHWPNSILDVDDLQSQIYLTSSRNARNIPNKINNIRMSMIWKRRESNFRNRFSLLSVCSENDRQCLGNIDNRIFVIPNGFETPVALPSKIPPKKPIIGFIGTFDYQLNVIGVEWFIKLVWPKIKKKIPGVHFRIIGKSSDAHPIAHEENIECLGWVEDPGLEMSTWSLMVVPVHVGGGTRIKIADAFSKGIPVVSTSLGAYGYDVTHGKEILLGDNPELFAESCIHIIEEKDLWCNLSINAWNKFINNWTWESYFPNVQAITQSILEKRNISNSRI